MEITDMRLHKLAGWSSLVVAFLYTIITSLYVIIGKAPSDITSALRYYSSYHQIWYCILYLSVFTDILYLPIMYLLYYKRQPIDEIITSIAFFFIILFVFLDLSITWPNYSVLIDTGMAYINTNDDIKRQILISAATNSKMILDSTLFGVYTILIPATGISLTALIKGNNVINRPIRIIGLLIGIFGIIAVLGGLFITILGLFAIIASVLTLIWFLLIGISSLKRISLT
jgi:hypothetical protein